MQKEAWKIDLVQIMYIIKQGIFLQFYTGILFHIWFDFDCLKFSLERFATAPRHTGWKGTELQCYNFRINYCCNNREQVIGIGSLSYKQSMSAMAALVLLLAAGECGRRRRRGSSSQHLDMTTPSRGDGVALYWERVRSVACARPGPGCVAY